MEISGGKGILITARVMFFFLALPLIFGSSLVCGTETITVNKAFNGREIKVTAGSIIRVELEQAGAAGYVWEFTNFDKEHFEVVGIETPEPSKKRDLVGGSMKKTWLIGTKTKGKSELRFIYSRPWEGQEKAADTFVVKVRIL